MSQVDITIALTPTINIELSLAGASGAGIAPGGTAGQILAKNSSSDYDTAWIDPNSDIIPIVVALG